MIFISKADRIARERATVRAVISLYCRALHGRSKGDLCSDCSELLSYACCRLDHCPFGVEKPACSDCSIHCYSGKKDLREQIKQAMRYAGPRMLLYHPVLALLHEWDRRRRTAPDLPRKTRGQRP